jgi:hypothetical protein
MSKTEAYVLKIYPTAYLHRTYRTFSDEVYRRNPVYGIVYKTITSASGVTRINRINDDWTSTPSKAWRGAMRTIEREIMKALRT